MKYSVGFQLYQGNEEPFSQIVKTYKEHISEVFFAWQDIASGRSPIATRHGYTDWSAQARTEEELHAIKQMGVKLDLLFNGNCYGINYDILYTIWLDGTFCIWYCYFNDL